METALHCATRAAEDLGDLVLGKVVIVAEQYGRALRLGQGREQAGRVERITLARGGIVGAVIERRGIAWLGRRPPMPIVAEVDGDLEEPRREAPPTVEASGRADDAEPRLLVDVIHVASAELAPEKLVQGPFIAAAEGLERVRVARRHETHELLVGGHPC